MIIGIDISASVYGTGVSNYTDNLVRSLIKIGKDHQFKLFFSSFRLPLPKLYTQLQKLPNVKIFTYKFPPTILDILWNRLHILPIEVLIGSCDIFHTSDWTQPPAIKAKLITTIHDLVPFLFPQWSHQKIIATHTRKMKWAVKECRQFICVSHNTKNDLLKVFPKIDPNNCQVVYEAAEQKYFDFMKLSKTEQEQKKNKIKNLYDLDKFILVQGTREPRKNLLNLSLAFEKFTKLNPKSKIILAITGKKGWGNGVESKSSHIKILGYIPEKDMVTLHASAMILALPSLYEGFGLGIVKSMTVGIPILTSANSSLSEISGNSSVLVDPTSVQSIYLGLKKILTNSKFRHKLSQNALTLSKNFSWTKAARDTLNIYQSL